MPALLPPIAKRAADRVYNILAARATFTSSSYNNARRGVSGAIIAVIVVIVVVVLCCCVGGGCFYNRSRKRRAQRQTDLEKWHAEHPNSGAYPQGNGNAAVPAGYAYGAGVDANPNIAAPGPAYTAGHHGAVDNSGGFSGAGGHSGGHGGAI